MSKKVDPVKKIFGKTAENIIKESSKYSPPAYKKTTFENVGPEEAKHFYDLLGILTDKELSGLVKSVGIEPYTMDKYGYVDRQILESWLEEAFKEDFYREYNKLLAKRHGRS